tara:strand:+ start:363 stop:1046 length:684 start_codon:yes stop_codon:yes gene_type:complete
MAIIITFEAIPESHSKPEDDLEFVILKGNKGDILLRETMEDNLEGYPEIVYDTESSKVFKRPNKLLLLQGALKGTISWEGDEIQATDIERYKTLNQNSVFEESTTSEAIANKEYVFTYTYGVDFANLLDTRGKWALAAKASMEATADNTRFLCTRTVTDYDMKAIDIPVGDTKTITKQQTTNYIYFSQKCSIGETDIPQFSVKKLTSDSVDITNKGEVPVRIVIVSK